MKNLISTVAILFFSLNTIAQTKSIKTETLSVKGNCEECKKRIENSADLKGVKISNWDEDKKVMTVTYNSEKITLLQIENAIVKGGHDVGNNKASTTTYNKLPECCKYRDNKCEKK